MGVMEELNALCGGLSWRFNYYVGETDQGAEVVVLDLAKAFERVSLPVVRACATHFNFPRKFCGCYAGTFSTSDAFSLKGVWLSGPRPSRPFSQGQVELFAPAHCAVCG